MTTTVTTSEPELSPSDKAVLTKEPILPSMCCVCNRSANGVLEFIDFQLNLDYYGSVNICTECMRSVAGLLKLVSVEKYHELSAMLNDQMETIGKLTEENAELNATLDAILKLRPQSDPRSVSTDEGSVEDSGEDQLQLELNVGDGKKK